REATSRAFFRERHSTTRAGSRFSMVSSAWLGITSASSPICCISCLLLGDAEANISFCLITFCPFIHSSPQGPAYSYHPESAQTPVPPLHTPEHPADSPSGIQKKIPAS